MIDEERGGVYGAIVACFWFGVALLRFLAMKLKRTGEIQMSEEKHGIKEAKEVLEGLNEVALLVIGQAKDGIQASDAVAIVEKLLLDSEFKAKLVAAVDGIGKVPAELGDLDASEIFELGKFEFEQVKKIISALK